MSGFDRLARPYRWMEYVSFGRALERCRFYFLPQLAETRHALLLGDGDGRFAARLLRVSPQARVQAVDGSEAMLDALRRRCAFAGDRVATYCADLSQALPETGDGFDLVTSHFFLDCLSTEAVERLVRDVRPRLAAQARWVVSEFAVPERGAMRWTGAAVVRLLYVAFRVMTGLRARRLPAYRAVLERHGFLLVEERVWMGGLLVSEMWRLGGPAASAGERSV